MTFIRSLTTMQVDWREKVQKYRLKDTRGKLVIRIFILRNILKKKGSPGSPSCALRRQVHGVNVKFFITSVVEMSTLTD
jgi:hypothetical protein